MFIFTLSVIFIFGTLIGSFLNCLIWRLRKEIPITPFIKGAANRSFCPKCKKQIAWYDNLPILSFIFLQGKCRHCGKSISIQYPLVELITGVLFVVAFVVNSKSQIPNYELIVTDYRLLVTIIRDWLLISVMIIVFVYDLRWYLILDRVVLPAAGLVFILNILLGFNWLNLLFSGIIGSSFFLFQFLISKGKWIGGGDIRLGLLMGLALGWPNVILAIILAYFLGTIVSLPLLALKKKQWKSEIPLGVFLSTTTIFVLFYGDKLFEWYWQGDWIYKLIG